MKEIRDYILESYYKEAVNDAFPTTKQMHDVPISTSLKQYFMEVGLTTLGIIIGLLIGVKLKKRVILSMVAGGLIGDLISALATLFTKNAKIRKLAIMHSKALGDGDSGKAMRLERALAREFENMDKRKKEKALKSVSPHLKKVIKSTTSNNVLKEGFRIPMVGIVSAGLLAIWGLTKFFRSRYYKRNKELIHQLFKELGVKLTLAILWYMYEGYWAEHMYDQKFRGKKDTGSQEGEDPGAGEDNFRDWFHKQYQKSRQQQQGGREKEYQKQRERQKEKERKREKKRYSHIDPEMREKNRKLDKMINQWENTQGRTRGEVDAIKNILRKLGKATKREAEIEELLRKFN